jgi:hypothetical protein
VADLSHAISYQSQTTFRATRVRGRTGREHCGQIGDYLVESSDGTSRIAPCAIFEDVYVAIGPADENWPPRKSRELPLSELDAKPNV